MSNLKPTDKNNVTTSPELNETMVVSSLEEHLRMLADHQGVELPAWYYW